MKGYVKFNMRGHDQLCMVGGRFDCAFSMDGTRFHHAGVVFASDASSCFWSMEGPQA